MGNIIHLIKRQKYIEQIDEDYCPICLEAMKDKNLIILECKHQFHASCIFKSLQSKNKKCPLCRKKIYSRQRLFYFS